MVDLDPNPLAAFFDPFGLWRRGFVVSEKYLAVLDAQTEMLQAAAKYSKAAAELCKAMRKDEPTPPSEG